MPEFGFGRDVGFSPPQVLPPSSDRLSTITPCRLRQRICRRLPPYVRMVGWMAASLLPSLTGPGLRQRPSGALIAMWTRQPSDSVLLPHRTVASASSARLSLIGPRKPPVERPCGDQAL